MTATTIRFPAKFYLNFQNGNFSRGFAVFLTALAKVQYLLIPSASSQFISYICAGLFSLAPSW